MAKQGTLIWAFVGSPTDAAEERKIVPEVVDQWNMMHARDKSAMVQAVLWETHASPSLDAPAQEVINRDLLLECDFLIAVFWTTLGSGGTVEEIENFRRDGKRVILYFSGKDIPQERLDPKAWKRREDYRNGMSGLHKTFKTNDELRRDLLRDVNDAVSQILKTPGVYISPELVIHSAFYGAISLVARRTYIDELDRQTTAQEAIGLGSHVARRGTWK